MALSAEQMSFREALGARLREIRKIRGMTQAQVAEVASLDPQNLQRAETARVALSVDRLWKVARALGVPMAELFADVGAEVPATPWDEDEAKVVARWRNVPADRRELLLRVIDEFAS